MKTVAVMQPYWIPYAGYFRLFEASDHFIVLDDVQFPRRGYVHRNKLLNRESRLEWITLPIEKSDRSTSICNLEFKPNATELLKKQTPKFPVLKQGFGVIEKAMSFNQPVIDTLVASMRAICNELDLTSQWSFSSELGFRKLRGQERIIALVKAVGGSRYVNAPGGVELYDAAMFSNENIELCFLPDWQGDYISILHYLFNREDKDKVSKMIKSQSLARTA